MISINKYLYLTFIKIFDNLQHLMQFYDDFLCIQEDGCPWSLKEMMEKYPQGEHILGSHVILHGIIHCYQVRGCLAAKLDPLGIQEQVEDLQKRNYKPPKIVTQDLMLKFLETDLNCEFQLPRYTFIGGKEKHLTLKEVITR